MPTPTVICLTPVKNERWILERFLKCASLWADHIVIADHMSDDGSREIARRFPKVLLVDNPSPAFDQGERHRMLIEAARLIPGPRLLIAMDADEMLTANFLDSPEWKTVLQAPAGTVIRFLLAVVRADLATYWLVPAPFLFGFMDDGSDYVGREIHSPRIPLPSRAPTITLNEIKFLHYVGADAERWDSKHRWYQCWERVHHPERRAVSIYRQYHRKDAIPAYAIRPLPREWLLGYERHGIDMTSVYREGALSSDKQVLEFLVTHGPAKFRREAIWDVDWSRLYRQICGQEPPRPIGDPRNRFDKFVHRWLERTQVHHSYYPSGTARLTRTYIRLVERGLQFLGW